MVALEQGKLTGTKPRCDQNTSGQSGPLQIEGRARDLAMFSLAIDSKLRGCDDCEQGETACVSQSTGEIKLSSISDQGHSESFGHG
jgi:hypothetical protein